MRQDSNMFLFFLEEGSISAALAEEEVARRVQIDSPGKVVKNVFVATRLSETRV